MVIKKLKVKSKTSLIQILLKFVIVLEGHLREVVYLTNLSANSLLYLCNQRLIEIE